MVTLSLTVTGSAREIEGVVRAIEQLPSLAVGDLPSDNMVSDHGQGTNLVMFAKLLSEQAERVLRFLCHNANKEFTAADLATGLSTSESELYGILGGIGRAWKKTSSTAANPFASNWSRDRSAFVWSIESDLASSVSLALWPDDRS